MQRLFVLNDPRCGTERSYNGLRRKPPSRWLHLGKVLCGKYRRYRRF